MEYNIDDVAMLLFTVSVVIDKWEGLYNLFSGRHIGRTEWGDRGQGVVRFH